MPLGRFHVRANRISRHIVVMTFVLSALAIITCPALATGTSFQTSAREASVRKFLQTLVDDKSARYLLAFIDLNGDGQQEAIVYLVSNEWCGSGGCSLFILSSDAGSWRVITRTTITWPPIRVLRKTTHGWHSITVWVGGGGLRLGYEAELKFDGETYPSNPTVAPARRADKNSSGDTIIRSTKNARPLYETVSQGQNLIR